MVPIHHIHTHIHRPPTAPLFSASNTARDPTSPLRPIMKFTTCLGTYIRMICWNACLSFLYPCLCVSFVLAPAVRLG